MPELPEVETIKNELVKKVVGSRIKEFIVLDQRLLRKCKNKDFLESMVKGKTIFRVDRVGKNLLFFLENIILVIHLGMTGRLELLNNQNNHKHLRALFVLDTGCLHYYDIRRFGSMFLVKTINDLNLGIEPFSERYTLENIKTLLKSNKNIKQFLLDQNMIAGLGNIYTDEVLWRSKISPLRKANSLTEDEIAELYESIPKVLMSAINLGGTTFKDFLNLAQEKGKFFQKLQVYGKEGSLCLRCSQKIIKTKCGGRSTHYCPYCQV